MFSNPNPCVSDAGVTAGVAAVVEPLLSLINGSPNSDGWARFTYAWFLVHNLWAERNRSTIQYIYISYENQRMKKKLNLIFEKKNHRENYKKMLIS